MQVGLFVICYFGFLILASMFLFRYRHVLMPTFIGAYIIAFFALNYIGIAILFFGLDAYRISIGVEDQGLLITILLLSIIAFSTVCSTYLFINRNYTVKRAYQNSSYRISKYEKYLVFVLLLFALYSVFQYISGLENIALLVALNGEFQDVMIARSEMGNNLGSMHWFRIVVLQLTVIIFYYYYLKFYNEGGLVKILLFVGFLSVSIILTLSTAKVALVQFIIGLLFLRSKYVKSITGLQMFQWGAICAVLIVSMYVIFTSVSDYETAIPVALSRMVTGSIAPAHFYLEFFPDVQPFLLGRSIPNPMGLLPWEPYSVSLEVMNWKFPHYLELGIVGSSPTAFWAEGYANFGYLGVILAGVYLGAFIAINQRVFERYNNFLFIRAVEGWMYFYIFSSSISGVTEYMKLTVLLPLIVLLVLPRLGWRVK